MRTIYLSSDFKCAVSESDKTVQTVQTDVFDGKCDAYIQGYRFVPGEQSWTRDDGAVFTGQMVAPWKDSQELEGIQREYEKQKLAEYKSALKTLGVQTE